MTDLYPDVAEAFSRKATIYDEFGRDHPNLDRMRRRFYDHIRAVMPPGGSLLELNAGTGQDAVELVNAGFRVHATDIAPGMLAEIDHKMAAFGLQDRLTSQYCSFTQLDQIRGGPYDGIYSNSGGLNCTEDLPSVVAALPALLRPGARITWVIMPRICPWELAVIPKDPRVGIRRLHRDGVIAHVEGVYFRTYYYSARDVRKLFGSRFGFVRLEGLSVLTPPADNKSFPANHPRLYRWLVGLDDRLYRHWPFNGWGDFYMLTMEFRG